MKQSTRFLPIFIIGILLTSLTLIPAKAAPAQQEGVITLSQTSAMPGATVIVTISGWKDVSRPTWAMIMWDGSEFVNGIDIDEKGNGSRQFAVPNADPGQHTVLVCDHSMTCLKSYLEVQEAAPTPAPEPAPLPGHEGLLSLSPVSGEPGTTVVATVSSWTNINTPTWAMILWDGSEFANGIDLDVEGNGNRQFVVPYATPGQHTVMVCDHTMTCLMSYFEVKTTVSSPTLIQKPSNTRWQIA